MPDTELPSQSQLQKWDETLTERTRIEAFFEWLEQEHGLRLIDANGPEWETPPPKSISDYLDQFHEIDRAQLDLERRTLLATVAS